MLKGANKTFKHNEITKKKLHKAQNFECHHCRVRNLVSPKMLIFLENGKNTIF